MKQYHNISIRNHILHMIQPDGNVAQFKIRPKQGLVLMGTPSPNTQKLIDKGAIATW